MCKGMCLDRLDGFEGRRDELEALVLFSGATPVAAGTGKKSTVWLQQASTW